MDEWFWAMFKSTPTWPNFDISQLFIWIGENRWIFWEKSPKWGYKFNYVLYYSELGRKMFFAIQKPNLVDIQSSRFRCYSFVFERTQNRLVTKGPFLIEHISIPNINHWYSSIIIFPCNTIITHLQPARTQLNNTPQRGKGIPCF